MVNRVDITDKAKKTVDELRQKHGELMFHLSGGCCDGSAPMCFPVHEFKTGGSDVFLGEVYGCKFYMAGDQFEYWKDTHITIDIVEGRGASFSLEIPLGVRFIIKSRLFTKEEKRKLRPVQSCQT